MKRHRLWGQLQRGVGGREGEHKPGLLKWAATDLSFRRQLVNDKVRQFLSWSWPRIDSVNEASDISNGGKELRNQRAGSKPIMDTELALKSLRRTRAKARKPGQWLEAARSAQLPLTSRNRLMLISIYSQKLGPDYYSILLSGVIRNFTVRPL